MPWNNDLPSSKPQVLKPIRIKRQNKICKCYQWDGVIEILVDNFKNQLIILYIIFILTFAHGYIKGNNILPTLVENNPTPEISKVIVPW